MSSVAVISEPAAVILAKRGTGREYNSYTFTPDQGFALIARNALRPML
jgi:hypothetical protein